MSKLVGEWFAVTMVGVLLFGLYAVVWGDPAPRDAELSAAQWFWVSYGGSAIRGFLVGAIVGLIVVWRRRSEIRASGASAGEASA